MLDKNDFLDQVRAIKLEVAAMAASDTPAVINDTANRLKGLNYTPPVGVPLDTFLSFTTTDLVAEIDRIANLSEAELPSAEGDDGEWDLKLQLISVLVFYFRELVQLRKGVPEAWDEVDEIYVHD